MSAPALRVSRSKCPSLLLSGGALALIALMALSPLLLEQPPVHLLPPFSSVWLTWTLRLLVPVLLLALLLGGAHLQDRSSTGLVLVFAVVGVGLTGLHWLLVDQHPDRAAWQGEYYLSILNHTAEAPHQYRPLPYGWARLLEWLTRNATFACLLYRWFCTTCFLWASFCLARLYLPRRQALLSLVPLVLLYPLSILYYYGQLTDPLSHFLFVLGLIYLLEDRPWVLGGALALGVLAKETAILLVPAYLAVHLLSGQCRRTPWQTLTITVLLGVVGTAAFLAARVPLGWRPGYQELNGTSGLMILTNLGLTDEPIAWSGVPLYQNYLQPLLFVGIPLGLLGLCWSRITPSLRLACVVLVPLFLICNLCFGWLYESRNYMPVVPLLVTAVLEGFAERGSRSLPA
jgi:hypothetical protein